jgi:glycosyltransferase involved in cell wall biosynthesis
MRLLYITPAFPYPLTSGYLRHYFLMRELARRHALTLLSLVGPGFRDEYRAEIGPFVEQMFTFSSNPRRSKLLRKGAQMLAGGDLAAKQLGRKAEELLAEGGYDAVIFSGKRTFPALAHVSKVPTVIDMCDAASARILGALRHGPAHAAVGQALRYARMRWTEARLAYRADHLLLASCRDGEALGLRDGLRASVVPNGVNLDYWRRSSPRLGNRTLVFTGAMHYRPNHDAALVLTEKIFPRLKRTFPDLDLLLVGRDPAEELLRAARRHGATAPGSVEDLRPYMERGSIFVAPLRFGMGVQNKLLEALAMELPVVTTPLAADGLRTEAGGQAPVDLADDVDAFVSRIAARLARYGEGAAPHVDGRRYVEENFTWASALRKLESAVATAVASHRQRNPVLARAAC